LKKTKKNIKSENLPTKTICLTHYEQMHKLFCFSLLIHLFWVVWEASGWVTQESDFVITAERKNTNSILSTKEMNLRGDEGVK